MIFDSRKPVLITGGAGFIGINLADRLLSEGQPVLLYDNLARAGVGNNLAWLRSRHGGRVDVLFGDVRDAAALRRAVRRSCRVFHLAAQVAVTTSLTDPISDFEVNARGTLNLLEAIRSMSQPPPLLYTSTNKVYGNLGALDVIAHEGRYAPADEIVRRRGISEAQPLDFHSPYGCSKGAADQYVLDYARVYGLPAVVFRMSCIYGPQQRGNEDQGWVAHFLLRALAGQPITIYGDGRQVRDVLFVGDLVEAMLAAHAQIESLSGQAFNIGGGVDNAVSLRDVLAAIGRLTGRPPEVTYGDWRPADQRYYVSDLSAFAGATGWRPRVSVDEGLLRLCESLRGEAAQAPSAAASAPALASVGT
jgi:CDP-paratose 2-epimerase